MTEHIFPIIDPIATGHNIVRLRMECCLSMVWFCRTMGDLQMAEWRNTSIR